MSATSDFLEKAFKIARLNEWRTFHPKQWQQFSDWAGTDGGNTKLNHDQRKWLKLIKRTGGADTPFERVNGFLVPQDFPPATDLSDVEWRQLYISCQNTWYQMKHDKDTYNEYKQPVRDFITSSAHLFDDVSGDAREARPNTVTAINALFDLLDKTNDSVLSALGITGPGGPRFVLQKLKDNNYKTLPAKQPKYNTDPEVRKQIIDIFDKVQNANGVLLNELNSAAGGDLNKYITNNRLLIINDEYTGWKERNTDSYINEFKANYADFMGAIYNDEDVFKAFEAKEAGSKPITNAINKVKKDIDYDDTNSKNYVKQKLDSEQNLFEKIHEWTTETYADYFKKYKELRGVQIYKHQSETLEILKQIDKAKIKTTDPLSKLVENADNITKALQSTHPGAVPAFEWLAKSLKEFNADPKFSKVMDKALKNGRKMNELVSELVMRAAEDGKEDKIEQVEIALEVLTTIRYGNLTSKIMDNLKEDKELFNIVSDKDLSWNKNEGMKFVTSAIDKSFRAACIGIGYGATFATNRLRRFGTKFNGRLKNQKMRQAYADYDARRTAERGSAVDAHAADTAAAPVGGGADTRSEYKKLLDKATKNQADAMADLRRDAAGNPIYGAGTSDKNVLTATQRHINFWAGREAIYKPIVEEFEQTISFVNSAAAMYAQAKKDLDDLDREQANTAADAGLSADEKNAIYAAIANQRLDIKKSLKENIKKQLGFNGKIDLSSIGMAPDYDLTGLDINRAVDDLTGRPGGYVAQLEAALAASGAKANLDKAQIQKYNRQQQLDNYHKATQEINEAQKNIDKRKERLDKLNKADADGKPMDIYKHLMGYWDTLQDPRLRRHGLRRASKIQASNADTVQDMFAQKLAGYTLR